MVKDFYHNNYSFIRLYVGVVDQTTKKMSILPASLTTMLPLHPGMDHWVNLILK